MKVALEQQDDPLDANLEKVLPGVHQWHQVNNNAVQRIAEDVRTLSIRVEGGFGRLEEAHLMHQLESDDRLASAFLNIANELMQRRGGGSTGTPASSPIRFQFPSNNNGNNNPPEAQPAEAMNDAINHTQFRLTHKQKTLSDVWDEWHGIGKFADELGGVEGRNAKYVATWRGHINGMAYSRVMRTIKAIKFYAEEQNMDSFDACAELQGKFIECKLSLAKFVDRCKQDGLLPTLGSRGRNKKSGVV
jgi:Transcriptional activator of glycolytic enzymes